MAAIIPAAANGSCFYISSVLAIEYQVAKRRKTANIPMNNEPLLDGHHSEVLQRAELLRSLLCEWYERGLQTIVPHLGFYDEASKQHFTRGDLLALEMVRSGTDVPEKGPERLDRIKKYLQHMRRPGTWASTPEYVALSHLCHCDVEIYTIEKPKEDSSGDQEPGSVSKIVLRDSIKRPEKAHSNSTEILGPIRLIFRDHHYDLLLNPEEASWVSQNLKVEVKTLTSEWPN